jgi:threonylcarbamoyladenosine tRNA methylthiotransferase MtaB
MDGLMKAAFYTLGCKVNQYETQLMEQRLAGAGYDIVGHEETADIYIINSCTVTGESDRKTRQILRRLKKQNPNSLAVLTGCFAQSFPQKAAAFKDADITLGVRERGEIEKFIEEALKSGGKLTCISNFEHNDHFQQAKAESFKERTRAFVKIEDGCVNYCSYCIIPFSRGPVRSKPAVVLKDELTALARAGYKEVVLVGINLSAYGSDLGLSLADAIDAAQSIEGLNRIRLGSLEPNIITEAFIERIKGYDKLCPHFHLSLQSGCEATLRRMNRRYKPLDYEAATKRLRAAYPQCGITTDIIVGFPGETAEEFDQSLAFTKKIGFSQVHVFPFSKRSGTRAAEMPDQIEKAEKEHRAKLMTSACAQSRKSYLESMVQQVMPVLFEEGHENGYYEGFAPNYVNVKVASETNLHGNIRNVRITGINEKGCTGEIE